MRATEIIRSILDIVDSINSGDSDETGCGCNSDDSAVIVAANDDDELRRFRQILGLAANNNDQYANTPDERISSIDSVTDAAGGGVNGPKHSADIRGEHGRLYGGN